MRDLEHLRDEELQALIVEDKRKAFHTLYERYKTAMLYYAAKRVSLDVAEDLVHDVFVGVWNNRNQIEFKEKFVGYLFRSLRHRVIDSISKDANAQKYVDNLALFLTERDTDKADYKLREELFMKGIYALIENFKPQYLDVFKLRMEGFTNPEIALKLSISEKTVRNQYSILLKYLKERLPVLFVLFTSF